MEVHEIGKSVHMMCVRRVRMYSGVHVHFLKSPPGWCSRPYDDDVCVHIPGTLRQGDV